MTTNSENTPYSELLGLTLQEAYEVLKTRNMSLRVTQSNGVHGFVTADYHTDRLNVSVTDGRISGVTGLG